MKTVAILGSTGSIGKNTLKVISRLKGKFQVIALAAGANTRLFAQQINQFRPRLAAIAEEAKFPALKKVVASAVKLSSGQDAVRQAAGCGADIVVMAISGNAAVLPTLEAVKHSKRVALANKECLVVAGDEIIKQAKNHKTEIIPVDSEHSAIFQCLKDEARGALNKIYLTGSGGPLRNLANEELEFVQPSFALKHPRWRMGKKISIDSATMMNKGFEVIEAQHLFNVEAKNITVIIHPEAVIHSLVEFIDGTILAQLGKTDMRVPIQYALTYPDRIEARLSRIDFSKTKKLTFHLPDKRKFPCLRLAFEAAQQKGLAGAVLSAADEECVWAYLNGKIKFTDIARIIEAVLRKLKNKSDPAINELLQADKWAREEVKIRI